MGKMNMELRQLKYFAKAAEFLNFSDAAKSLNVTQSTLSQQIRQLEDNLNVQLFQRDSHSVSLTEVGKELLPYALETLHAAATCYNRILDLQKMQVGTLNIGVTFSFSSLLTETLFMFMKQYPRIKLNIYYKSMAELMDMLQRREVDFVLAFKSSKQFEGIESHVLFDNQLAVIVNEYHSLASLKKIDMEKLAHYDVALPSKGLQARNAIDDIMSHYFCNLNIRIELNEVNILLKIIRQSNLVTILSEATIYSEQGVKAIPLDIANNEMQGCVHMLKKSYRKQSAIEFLKMLSESNAIRERIRKWI